MQSLLQSSTTIPRPIIQSRRRFRCFDPAPDMLGGTFLFRPLLCGKRIQVHQRRRCHSVDWDTIDYFLPGVSYFSSRVFSASIITVLNIWFCHHPMPNPSSHVSFPFRLRHCHRHSTPPFWFRMLSLLRHYMSPLYVPLTRTQFPIRKGSGISVINSNPDSHCCPDCAEKVQNWLWNLLKIKPPQKNNLGKLSRNALNSILIWYVNTIHYIWINPKVKPMV